MRLTVNAQGLRPLEDTTFNVRCPHAHAPGCSWRAPPPRLCPRTLRAAQVELWRQDMLCSVMHLDMSGQVLTADHTELSELYPPGLVLGWGDEGCLVDRPVSDFVGALGGKSIQDLFVPGALGPPLPSLRAENTNAKRKKKGAGACRAADVACVCASPVSVLRHPSRSPRVLVQAWTRAADLTRCCGSCTPGTAQGSSSASRCGAGRGCCGGPCAHAVVLPGTSLRCRCCVHAPQQGVRRANGFVVVMRPLVVTAGRSDFGSWILSGGPDSIPLGGKRSLASQPSMGPPSFTSAGPGPGRSLLGPGAPLLPAAPDAAAVPAAPPPAAEKSQPRRAPSKLRILDPTPEDAAEANDGASGVTADDASPRRSVAARSGQSVSDALLLGLVGRATIDVMDARNTGIRCAESACLLRAEMTARSVGRSTMMASTVGARVSTKGEDLDGDDDEAGEGGRSRRRMAEEAESEEEDEREKVGPR